MRIKFKVHIETEDGIDPSIVWEDMLRNAFRSYIPDDEKFFAKHDVHLIDRKSNKLVAESYVDTEIPERK